MGEWPNESRLSALQHPSRLRREPAPAADRSHRPLPVPPRRPRGAVGRDLAGDGDARAGGKIVYVGSSNFAGWHIAQANEAAGARHFLGLVSEQCLYNLTRPERRARGAARRASATVSASSRRARSPAGCSAARCRRRARAGARASRPRRTSRSAEAAARGVGEAVRRARARRRPTWRSRGCCRNPVVTAPIIGPRTVEQLDGTLRALEIELSDETLGRARRDLPRPRRPRDPRRGPGEDRAARARRARRSRASASAGWQAGGTGPWGAGPEDADDDAAIAAIRSAVECGRHVGRHGGLVRARTLRGGRRPRARAVAGRRGGARLLQVRPSVGAARPDLDRPQPRRRSGAQCEESLRRLGVERIDLYQFHHPDPSTPVEESWATLAELVDEGKVRWAGLSNFDVEQLERCEAIRHVDCLQPELSLLRPEAARDVIPWCRDHGTGVIVYSPKASGLLSGSRGLAPTRRRDRRGAQGHSGLGDRRARRPGSCPWPQRHGVGPGAIAVAWTLSEDGVTGAICGARSPDPGRGVDPRRRPRPRRG